MADRADMTVAYRRSAWPPAFVGIALLCSSCLLGPPVYFARSIEGRVIDAETGKPIEGAVVVATWETAMLSLDTKTGPTLYVHETTTDGDGRYRIRGWGPKPRAPLTTLNPYRDPAITIFKSRYKNKVLSNNHLARSIWSPIRDSDWDGQTVELDRFTGNAAQRRSQIWQIIGDATGSWSAESVPRLLDELLKDEEMFSDWPPEGRRFFESVRILRRKGT